MKKDHDPQLQEALVAETSTLLDLVNDAQRSNGWPDEELERLLGLKDANVMTLIREGAVHLSYSAALNIETHLQVNALEMLQAFTRDQASALEQAVLAMYEVAKVDEISGYISLAYKAAASGDKRVSSLKLPHATVWVMPHAAMKPEEVIEATD